MESFVIQSLFAFKHFKEARSEAYIPESVLGLIFAQNESIGIGSFWANIKRKTRSKEDGPYADIRFVLGQFKLFRISTHRISMLGYRKKSRPHSGKTRNKKPAH